MNRGDVVLVHIPFVGAPGGKIRPAVVLQNDVLNRSIRETIVAEITSNISNAAKPQQTLIDVSTPDGAVSGLLVTSAIRCDRLHTIPQVDVQRVIGALTSGIMANVETSLKAALGIP